MKKLLSLLDGKKTILAGVGLLGLAVFQASQGQIEGAIQTGLAGLAALGIRHALAKQDAAVAPNSDPKDPVS